ncbi:glycosyl transferase [Escherichia ruysiae]|uniref:glycosyl transferase n=1 Tax=Escherichia ruysiae TaxID=2608867 RepID=UPI00182259F1|nr:glycosyl transferase [Escherichia ruysiae]EFC1528486.1 glycosyl transferase [Escherichia coli]EFC9524719.1 glycosyl transferase [Escherichia coli]MBY7381750.1 glycosyl transferase [Escherichia ruysiae]MBY7431047.1 glycosyl transferase [Escherichia ruysiae]MEC9879695.1 glycosyl transferase [Escherichia ruysiae]
MKVHIYFRHTDISRTTKNNRPEWFSHEKCFVNLINTIKNSKYKDQIAFNFIFDGSLNVASLDPLYQCFEKIDLNNKKIFIIDGGDQRKAWRECVKLVDEDRRVGKIVEHDLIYFLENDYLHETKWVDELFNLAKSNIRWDMVTLYDHPDKYSEYCEHPDSLKNKNKKTIVYYSGTRHWKITPSTCATYIMKAKVFDKTKMILQLAIYDYKLFLILTNIFRIKLISPIPALSTHCMASLLSPSISWENL